MLLENVSSEIFHQVVSILDQGDIPLISVTLEGKPNIIRTSLKGTQTPSEFIALSHVRSQHLWSDRSSKCSLLSLQKLVNDLPECQSIFLERGAEAVSPWWIDAICIPPNYHRFEAAKRDIKRIFEAAMAVLVLDSSLHSQAPGSSTECLTAIRRSPWMKRLWTLQEAAVAKKLYIRFSNATVLLGDLNESEWQAKHRLPTEQNNMTLETYDAREKLRCLDRFDEDMKAIFVKKKRESLTSSTSSSRDLFHDGKPGRGVSGVDLSYEGKFHLRSILRLGYLSLPIFTFLRDSKEETQSQLVIERIVALYKNASNRDRETDSSVGAEKMLGALADLNFDRPLEDRDEIE